MGNLGFFFSFKLYNKDVPTCSWYFSLFCTSCDIYSLSCRSCPVQYSLLVISWLFRKQCFQFIFRHTLTMHLIPVCVSLVTFWFVHCESWMFLVMSLAHLFILRASDFVEGAHLAIDLTWRWLRGQRALSHVLFPSFASLDTSFGTFWAQLCYSDLGV